MDNVRKTWAVFATVKEALDFADDLSKREGRPFKICKPRSDNSTFSVIEDDDVKEEDSRMERHIRAPHWLPPTFLSDASLEEERVISPYIRGLERVSVPVQAEDTQTNVEDAILEDMAHVIGNS